MKLIYRLFIFFCLSSSVLSQETLPIIKKHIDDKGFIDFYQYRNGIVSLTTNGKIYYTNLVDTSSSELSRFPASCIAVDRQGSLWAIDSFSSSYVLKDTGWKWDSYIGAARIWKLLFCIDNSPIFITDLGVLSKRTNTFYGENWYRNRPFSEFVRTRYNISCAYIDKNNNLWMGINSRRGAEVHVFSIRKNKFITPSFKGFTFFRRVQDIFGGGKEIFFVDQDFMFGMSAIMTYKKDTMLRIHHPEYDTSRFGPKRDDEDFIGTGYYDYASKEIYYFSSLGLMKCRYSSGKRKITKTEIIIPGQKEWNGYEFENSRFPAYLRKMIKIRNQIIYLHRDDRIFITDGKKIINLK